MALHPLDAWHQLLADRDPARLADLLDESAVFHSPVVHSPQHGRALVAAYLGAAMQLLGTADFRYLREVVGEHDAALEFETRVDGVVINGVDLIRWNTAGRIIDFKVMLRPLKAIQLVHGKMAALLQQGQRDAG